MEVDARIPDLVIDTQQAIRDGQAKVALDPLAVTAALNEIDRLAVLYETSKKCHNANILEINRLRRELESAESIAWDYEAGQVIQLEEIDNLKAEIVDIREQLARARSDRSSPDMVKWAQEEATKSERQRCVEIAKRLEKEHGYLGGAFKMTIAAIETPTP